MHLPPDRLSSVSHYKHPAWHSTRGRIPLPMRRLPMQELPRLSFEPIQPSHVRFKERMCRATAHEQLPHASKLVDEDPRAFLVLLALPLLIEALLAVE